MFFNTALKEENRSLRDELSSLNALYEDLKSKFSSLKTSNDNLENEKKELIRQIENLKAQNATQDTQSFVVNDSGEYEELASNLEVLFKSENQNLKSGLLDIQGNIAESTELARESLSASDEISQTYRKSSKSLESIVEDVAVLNSTSSEVNVVINELDKKARNISEALSLIKDVVLQTNILSLNAAVEAASAGEAGKGFAVVAGEVKNLANKTAEAAKNIEEVVKTIQNSVQLTNQKFDNITKSIEGISEKTTSYSSDMQRVFHLSDDTFRGLGKVTDRVFMSLAKLDHIIWKVNTYLSVAEHKQAFNFVDHKNCRLGKWYNEGLGRRYFSQTPSYPKLDRPHAIVHNGTHKVFDAIDGNSIDYPTAISALKEMEDASKEVFRLLDMMLSEVKH